MKKQSCRRDICVETSGEKGLEDLGLKRRMILKCNLEKYDVILSIVLIRLTRGIFGRDNKPVNSTEEGNV